MTPTITPPGWNTLAANGPCESSHGDRDTTTTSDSGRYRPSHVLLSVSRGGPPLGQLHAGGEAEFGVDVGEVGSHGARRHETPVRALNRRCQSAQIGT
jgi:hypothetical protein